MVNKIMNAKKIVCLGGGVGTVNLLRGIKSYSDNISVVVSMADDGGSSGRLRRLFNVFPLGDMVSCMAAMAKDETELTQKLLTYRFGGERYGRDTELGGHKLGNLILVALKDITGSYDEAINKLKTIFGITGNFFPATKDNVSISARTIEGKEIFGEEKIDLGKYKGKRILDRVFLHPEDAVSSPAVIAKIKEADAIICGPGDLYTNLLPVLIVKDITKALLESSAKKIFVVNVANKPFETKGYAVKDYVDAVIRHIGSFPFSQVVVNNNFSVSIPKQYHYAYVTCDTDSLPSSVSVIEDDLVNADFPIYHSPTKLANTIAKAI